MNGMTSGNKGLSSIGRAQLVLQNTRLNLQNTRSIGIFLVIVILLSACSVESGEVIEPNSVSESSSISTTEEMIFTHTATQTVEPTPTVTITPTATQEPTPTATPMIKGNIEVFLEDMEDGDVLWDMLKVQEIVNGYDEDSGMTFNEYIIQKRGEIEDKENYEDVSNILEEISKEERLSDIALPKILQKTVPELDIVNFSPWPESMYDTIPDAVYRALTDAEWFPFGEKSGFKVAISADDIWIIVVDMMPLNLIYPGDIISDSSTFDPNKESNFDLYTILEVKEISGETFLLAVTVNDEGNIELFSVSESEVEDVFSHGWWWILWGRLEGRYNFNQTFRGVPEIVCK